MAGIDEETVDFVPNYSNSTEEPVVLPARFPNLLVNGSQGIAVGMATNIPPHNLGEVIDATMHLIDHPEATPDDLMQFVKGPDFPTGALILGRQGIIDAYRTGRGSIKMRAVAEIDESRGATSIVVTELPYQTSVEVIEQKIDDLVRGRRARRHRRGPERLGGPQAPPGHPAQARRQRQRRAQQALQAHAAADQLRRQHAGPGRRGAPHPQPGPDARPLRGPPGRGHHPALRVPAAQGPGPGPHRRGAAQGDRHARRRHRRHPGLRGPARPPGPPSWPTPFSFSEEQANHILDMQLGRLTRLGRTELEEEMAKLRETIAELEAILADDAKLRGVIKTELGEIRERFADERRSVITHDPGEMAIEDLIDDEEIVVTMTAAGYVKAVPADAFRTQGRGGRGVQGARLKEEDLVTHVVHTIVARLPAALLQPGPGLPAAGPRDPDEGAHGPRHGAGQPAPARPPARRIQAIVQTRDFPADHYLMFATVQGQVKKTAFSEYDKSRREGFIAINLRDGDSWSG